MNPDDLNNLLEKRRKDNDRRQSKRAVIGAFVIIPGAVLIAVAIWLVPRLLEM